MDKQKQIEEMTELMADWALRNNMCWHEGHAKALAETFVENDYGKIPENAVVLTEEEYEKLQALKDDYVKGYEAGVDEGWDNARKETAERLKEKFRQRYEWLKEKERLALDKNNNIAFNCFYNRKQEVGYLNTIIDEICKEITEGKV